jgi:hypothetical protein
MSYEGIGLTSISYMIFGNTELKVTAFDEKFGVECSAVIDLICLQNDL